MHLHCASNDHVASEDPPHPHTHRYTHTHTHAHTHAHTHTHTQTHTHTHTYTNTQTHTSMCFVLIAYDCLIHLMLILTTACTHLHSHALRRRHTRQSSTPSACQQSNRFESSKSSQSADSKRLAGPESRKDSNAQKKRSRRA
jgi:hypothetical protein